MRTAARLLSAAVVLLATFASLGFGPALVDRDDPQMALGDTALQQLSAGGLPDTRAAAELIMDCETGEVLFEINAHVRRAPASITKIMTALVALDKGDLKQHVLIQPEDVQDGAAMGVYTGDVLTLEDLLWGMLLPSGNDAAHAIARAVGGTVPAFVEMMNAKAADLGLTDTHFANPHGLDAPGHYSTAYDIAVMARVALANPVFARMVATDRHTVEASRQFQLENANGLILHKEMVPGVDGVKTGSTEAAGECLVASATRQGQRFIVVVLGADDREGAAASLLDHAFSTYIRRRLGPPAHTMFFDEAGQKRLVQMASPDEALATAWEWASLRSYVQVDTRSAKLSAGQQVGVVSYYAGDREIARRPLVLKAPY